RLVPGNADYFTHSFASSDDIPSHIRVVLTRTSEKVPIVDGKMQLGTWQGIFLFKDRRAPHRRKLFLTVTGKWLRRERRAAPNLSGDSAACHSRRWLNIK